MLLSAVFFSMINTTIRSIEHMPTFQLVFFRAFGSLLLCAIYLKKNRIPFRGHNEKWLIWRGLTGLISMSLFYYALLFMPMGTAVSLRYLSPFFAVFLAIIFLGERVRSIQWLYFIMAFLGVVILKGFDTRIGAFGLTIILTCAFFSGVVYTLIRKIGTTEHPVVIVLYFMAIATLVSGLATIFMWKEPLGMEWLALISLGFYGYFAQFYMTKAMQIVESNFIVPFKYAEVVLTLLAGWVIFGEGQSVLALLAIALIVIALIGNVQVKKRPNISDTKTK